MAPVELGAVRKLELQLLRPKTTGLQRREHPFIDSAFGPSQLGEPSTSSQLSLEERRPAPIGSKRQRSSHLLVLSQPNALHQPAGLRVVLGAGGDLLQLSKDSIEARIVRPGGARQERLIQKLAARVGLGRFVATGSEQH